MLYELMTIPFTGTEEALLKLAIKQANKVFSVPRFAIFSGSRLLASLGEETRDALLKRMGQGRANQFLYRSDEAGSTQEFVLFMEQTHPISSRENRLYAAFSQRLAEALITTRSIRELRETKDTLRENAGQFEARTEQQAKQHTAELTRVKEKAEAINQARSNYLAHMNHELRTPLNVILGNSQLLKRRHGENPALAAGLDMIRQSGESLLSMFNGMLDVANAPPECPAATPSPAVSADGPSDLGTGINTAAEAAHLSLSAETTDREIMGYSGPRRKMLVVDDIAFNRELFIDLLAPVGFEMFQAPDGRTAIDLARTCTPDAIIMDLRMPGMDGMTAARKMRQITALKDSVLIAMSGDTSVGVRSECGGAGFDDFIPKPVDWHYMTEVLARHLKLQWVYAPQPPLIVPPRDELEHLRKLITSGKLPLFSARAQALVDADNPWSGFAGRLLSLAGRYEIIQIKDLLNMHLENKE